MKATTRSTSGAVLMLAIIPIIVGLLACMPVPVGDPERSRIDPAMNGVWALTADGDDDGYYLFRPWDKRTWLVIGVEKGGEVIKPATVYKAWLARLGGETFMTWELAGGFDTEGGFTPEYWFVFRVDKDNADRVMLNSLDYDYAGFEAFPDPDDYDGNYVQDMRRKFERVIRKNVDDEAMYGDSLELRRLTGDELAEASKRFGKVVAYE